MAMNFSTFPAWAKLAAGAAGAFAVMRKRSATMHSTPLAANDQPLVPKILPYEI